MLRVFSFLMLIGVAPLRATSCAYPATCARLHPGSIVFIGTVVSVENLPNAARGRFVERTSRLRMTVRENFIGLPPDTKEVILEAGDWMLAGNDYLLDVSRNDDGSYTPTPCGQSQAVNEKDEFLGYLRSRQKGALPTSLTVHVAARTALSNQWVSGADVIIRGPDGEQRARSNATGDAVFDKVTPGVYSISATQSLLREDPDLSQDNKVTVVDQSCAGISIYLQSQSTVTGSLRLADGKEGANLEVELIGVDPERAAKGYSPATYTADTGPDGQFTFTNVFPGRYLLGTNILFENMATSRAPRSYYPGRSTRAEAAEILVVPGANVEGLQFLLPDVGPKRAIHIRVVDETGVPLKGARVTDRHFSVKNDSGRFGTLGENLTTDAEGWVTTEGFEAAYYTVSASNGPSLQNLKASDAVEITPGKGPLTIQLIVRPRPLRR